MLHLERPHRWSMRPRVCQERGQSGDSLTPKGGLLSALIPHHRISQMETFPRGGKALAQVSEPA